MTLSEHIKQKRKKNCFSKNSQCFSKNSQCFSKNSQCFSKNSQCFSRKSQCLFSGNPFHLEINELETSKTSLAQMALVPPLLGGFAAASPPQLFHCILFYHLLVELLLCGISHRLYT